MYAIEIEHLRKGYGELAVLRDLTLNVREGEVFGLLGPNGAGKSTLIHVLLGFLRPSSGTVRVLGSDDLELVRRRLGYIPERLRYHTRYSAREYLRFLGQFSDLSGPSLRARVDAELEEVGLLDAADRRIGTFSKGMLQRLGIAQALLHEPELLLIDEPTSGLDPSGQREMIDILSSMRASGRTILMTTHYLQEVEQLCDRIGVLADGRLAVEADMQQLRLPSNSVVINVETIRPDVAERLKELSPAVQPLDQSVLVRPNTPELQAQVLRLLLDYETPVVSVQPQERPLERLYMQAVRGEPITQPTFVQPPQVSTSAPAAPRTPAAPSDAAPSIAPSPQTSKQAIEGDALLKELLRRDKNPSSNADEPR